MNKNSRQLISLFLIVAFIALAGSATWKNIAQADFNNGTYTNTSYDSTLNAVTLSNWTAEMPDSQATNSTTRVNMTGNVLLMHMNDGTWEFPASQATANDMNMTGNVLLLHMNGNANDGSGIGNNGIVSGATLTNTAKLGTQAYSFDRIGDYINISNDASLDFGANQPFSISLWFYEVDNPSANHGVLSKRDAGGNGYQTWMTHTGGASLYSFRVDSGGSTTIYSDYNLSINNWYHAVVTRNSSGAIKMYINATLQADTATDSGSLSASSTEVFVAALNSGGAAAQFFNGTMDEVAIWNRSLSAGEVKTIYDVQAPLVQDTSGMDNNGTGRGQVNCSATGKIGDYGCEFDGDVDYVKVSDDNSLDFDEDDFSVAAWFKLDDTGNNQAIFSKGYDDEGTFWMRVRSTNRIQFMTVNLSTQSTAVESTNTISSGTWYHVVGARNDTGVYLYVDGVLNNETAGTVWNMTSTRSFVVGARNIDVSPTQFFNGTIDEVALWNRSLSASEVSDLYYSQYGKYYETGEYVSEIINLGSDLQFNNISWSNSTPTGCELNLSVRSCNDVACSGESWNGTYTNSSYVDISDLTNNQYFQYKFFFSSNGSGDLVPKLYNVTMDYGDSKLPNVTISRPQNTSYTTTTIPFNVTALDETRMGTCLYSLNSGVDNFTMTNTTSAPTMWNATNSTMAQGSHTVNFYCNDSSNNWNTTESRIFFIDSIYPDISVSTPSNNTNTTNTGLDINFTRSDTNLKTCWYSNDTYTINKSLGSSCVNVTNITWSEGEHNVTIWVNDSVGNENSTKISFRIDTTAPIITLGSPADSTSSTTSAYNFTFTVSDKIAVDSCVLIFDGSSIHNLTSVSKTTTNGMYNSSLSVTTHTWNVNCTDAVGNTGNSSSRTLIVSSRTTEDTSGTSGGTSSSSSKKKDPGIKTKECISDSGCGEKQICELYKCEDVECTKTEHCDENEECKNHKCRKLFDVKIEEFETQAKVGESFEFSYFVKGMANISDDVEIKFWLEKDGIEITSGMDTIYIGDYEEKIETASLSLPQDLASGAYDFYVEIDYGDYVAKSSRTVYIEVGPEGLADISLYFTLGDIVFYAFISLAILAVLVLLIVILTERRRSRKKELSGWFNKHKVSVIIFELMILLGIGFYILFSEEIISFSFMQETIYSIYNWGVENILPVFSSTHPYYNYVIGGIGGLAVLVILIFIRVLVRKGFGKHSHKKLVKKKIKKEKRLNDGRGFFRRHKIFFLILLVLIILVGIIFYLFYSGIITLEYLYNVWRSISDWFVNLFN